MRWHALLSVLVLGGVVFGAAARGASEPAAPPARDRFVVVAPIEGMIDLGLVPYVDRVLKSAAQDGAAAVLLEVNTFGGRVDAAVAIRDLLLRSEVRTIAFVNKRAISAGALITLAAETIVVASGATIGAATPVQLGAGGEAAPTSEKTVSYVRKEFRATADARGRPGLVAEAMVDEDVAIPGLVDAGKLLTLTGAEALAQKIADHQADDVAAALAAVGLGGAAIRPAKTNWAELAVRFLTHPIVASLLITLAMLGLVVEIRTPGFGVAGVVGLLCLAAFFWGHALVRLVGWEEVILLVLGLALLALEVFVIPGFGIVGFLGIAALAGGLALSLVGGGATLRTIVYALARVAIAGGAAVVLSVLLLRFLPHVPAGRKLVLGTTLPAGGSHGHEPASSLVGVVGSAHTSLRPAGIAELAGRRVDVVSDGEYIEAGSPVEVVEAAGSRVVVRAHRPPASKGGA
jgi:membrane-bound serine protease (ClpP class)